ncbi:MAG: glutathione S-transferase family protein [Betaproteobacteria bacterium]|nr:glutathione S-transferase family protein [Betaproteobacteria bacterium]
MENRTPVNIVSTNRILWGVGTSRTLRALWTLLELDLPFEHQRITSRSGETLTPEYTQLNPSQKIPTLQEGDFILAESAAIVNYLLTTHGAAKNLAPPSEPRLRARYDQWCFFCMMELDANTLYVIRKHDDLHKLYGEAPHALQAARDGFARQANAAAQRLADGRPYVLGENFSGADILFTTCLTGAIRRDIALPETLHEYLKRITARAAYQSAAQRNQVVAPK